MRASYLLVVFFCSWSVFSPLKATWSIVLVDTETGEVGIGTVTCLNNFDLLSLVPVVVVTRGAAAVQASGDFDGIRRPIIFDGFLNGQSPAAILDQVAAINGHESRQYGIVDREGDAITFTGNQTFSWAGGITGTVDNITYAIQGNILTGACVVGDIELALMNTVGDMAAKLMAGMQAAKSAGGDGRCSCPGPDPENCGCPVAVVNKAGHIGGMIVARPGDSDDAVCDQDGCADGDYYMRLNVANQVLADPDPVDQLQILFDNFRQSLIGRTDASQSVVTLLPPRVPPNGISVQIMQLTLRDWQGQTITTPATAVQVSHAPASAGLSSIGNVTLLAAGVVEIELTAGSQPGLDQFVVTVDDGVRPVQLMPNPQLVFTPLGDLDGDTSVDVLDMIGIIQQIGPCPAGGLACLADTNGDGQVTLADLLIALPQWL